MRRSMSLALILAGLTSVSLGTRAKAADMPPWPQSEPAGRVTEFVSGWYLRGDVGYRTDIKIGDVYSSVTPPVGVSLKEIATIGGGGGYKAGWFRADVTFDYGSRSRFYTLSNPNGSYDAKVSTLVGLANVYLDLGTWSGITPYVGVGAGAAYFWINDYAPPNGPVHPERQQSADFAWAYMAGLAWSFAPRWNADFSYRYLNLGEATFNSQMTNFLTIKDVTANEFRLGLRYSFD